jgi:hypothetical protein
LFYAASKLHEAGYIRAVDYGGTEGEDVILVTEMTMAGHRLLESVRDPAAWRSIKSAAAKVGNFSLDVLMELGKAYVTTEIKKLGL